MGAFKIGKVLIRRFSKKVEVPITRWAYSLAEKSSFVDFQGVLANPDLPWPHAI
jgi:hypothetical protein